jgi:hypothetical protein
MDEKTFEISQHLGFENVKDVTLKNAMKNLLMALDFSNIESEGNENCVVALLASKVAIENYSNSETKTNYLVGWIKEKLRIEGAARQVDGPWKDSKALMIEGLPGLTKIFGPPSAVNSSEGSLAVWARLTNSGKTYSDLVNVPGIIYIYHQGNGKFIVNYNGAGGSTDLAIKDDNWYHYVFTWKDRNQRFYINGLEALAGTVSGSTAASAGTFAIGWLGYGNADKQEQWHGPLAKFLTFDRALTPTEVTALYRWRRLLQEN